MQPVVTAGTEFVVRTTVERTGIIRVELILPQSSLQLHHFYCTRRLDVDAMMAAVKSAIIASDVANLIPDAPQRLARIEKEFRVAQQVFDLEMKMLVATMLGHNEDIEYFEVFLSVIHSQ